VFKSAPRTASLSDLSVLVHVATDKAFQFGALPVEPARPRFGERILARQPFLAGELSDGERAGALARSTVDEHRLRQLGELLPELVKLLGKRAGARDGDVGVIQPGRTDDLPFGLRRERLLGMRQPHLSQHLTRLRTDGLVRTRRVSRSIYYRLGSEPAERVLALLYDLFCAKKAAATSASPVDDTATAEQSDAADDLHPAPAVERQCKE